MIEIIQQTAKTEDNMEGKLPKNIRQIGNPEKDFRIYMEDYVYTYLHPAQIHGMEIGFLPRLLILLGEINHFSNRSCAFISGAIQVENGESPEELPEFDEKTWRRIHKEMQQYFDKCEIVGWVLDIPGNSIEITVEMEEIHRKNFVSQYQFFFLMDSKEREEAFYIWKDGRLTRKEGYFIYYEKNPQMQEYMISRREILRGEPPKPEEVNDRAARNYRAMMMAKKESAYKQRASFLSYLTSILTVIALSAVSVILLGNIHRMEDMEQTISVMSTAIEPTEQEKDNPANQVAVETISGNIIPIGDAGANAVMEEERGNSGEQAALDAAKAVAENQAAVEAKAAEEERVAEEAKAAEEAREEEEAKAAEEAREEEEAKAAEEARAAEEAKAAEEARAAEEAKAAEEAGAAESRKQDPVMTEAEKYRAQGYYIVREGDSLRQICYNIYQTYAVVDAVCEANNIEDQDFIYAGQKILLP